MAWMETDYSKYTHFRWKIKWWLEHLGALGIMGAPLTGAHLSLCRSGVWCERSKRRPINARPCPLSIP